VGEYAGSGLGNLNPISYVAPQESALRTAVADTVGAMVHDEVAARFVRYRTELTLRAQVAVSVAVEDLIAV
jgi:hypothetical protein